jgi:hypothetical protein
MDMDTGLNFTAPTHLTAAQLADPAGGRMNPALPNLFFFRIHQGCIEG